MAKVYYPPACDAALLSAYRDEALDSVQCRRIEGHLEGCPACRQELAHYELLAVGLRRLSFALRSRPISSVVTRRPAAPQLPPRPLRSAGALFAVSLLAAIVVGVLVQWGPQHRSPLVAAYPPAGIPPAVLGVPATPSPVALLRADQAAAPLGANAEAPSPLARFGAATPVANSTPDAASALAENLERPTLLPPCAPANVFTPIYSSRGDARTALGCVDGAPHTTTIISQDFQRGILLAAIPDGQVYELTVDGLWREAPLPAAVTSQPAPALVSTETTIGSTFSSYRQSHPVLDGTLGSPVSAEAEGQGLLQPFAHGFMLETAGWTYIADDAGQWQRLVSLLPGDEGTPSTVGGVITGGVPSFPPLRSALTRGATASPTQACVRFPATDPSACAWRGGY
ncbi:MAG: zf-HC2 domain-containing protein [Chloroflexota bacterium]